MSKICVSSDLAVQVEKTLKLLSWARDSVHKKMTIKIKQQSASLADIQKTTLNWPGISNIAKHVLKECLICSKRLWRVTA